MNPILIAIRESDRQVLLEYDFDLNEMLGEELFLAISTIETIFDYELYPVFGYEYDINEVIQNQWVKELKETFDSIIDHLEIDNGTSDTSMTQLWIYGNSEVKVTLKNGEVIIGCMDEFNDEDINYAWLILRITESNELRTISFNDVKNVVKYKRADNKKKSFKHRLKDFFR